MIMWFLMFFYVKRSCGCLFFFLGFFFFFSCVRLVCFVFCSSGGWGVERSAFYRQGCL